MQSKTLYELCQEFSGDLTEITTFLRRKGADQLNSLNDEGYNPLHLILKHGLKNNANADQVFKAVQLLIENDANANAVDMRGRNLLHLAVEFNYRQVDNEKFEALINKLIEQYPKMLEAVDKQDNTLGHLMMRHHYSKIPEISDELFKKLCPEECHHTKNKTGISPYDLVFVFSPEKTTLGKTQCSPKLLFEIARNGANVENFATVLCEVEKKEYKPPALIKAMVNNENLGDFVLHLTYDYVANNPEQAIDDLWPVVKANDSIIAPMLRAFLHLKNTKALKDLAQRCRSTKSTYTPHCYVALIVLCLEQQNTPETEKELLRLINALTKFDHDIFAQQNDDAFDTIDVFLQDAEESILASVIQALRHKHNKQLAQADQLFITAVGCELEGSQESLELLKMFILQQLETSHQSPSAREFIIKVYLKNEKFQAAKNWLRTLPNIKDPEVMKQLGDILVEYRRFDIAIDLYCRAIKLAPKDKEIVNRALEKLNAINIQDVMQFYTLANAIIAVVEGENYDDSVLRQFFDPYLLTLFTKAAVQTADERSSIGSWFSPPPALCTQYAKAYLCLLDDDHYNTCCEFITRKGMALCKDTILFYQSLQSDDSALKAVGLAHEELVARAANILSLLNPYSMKRAFAGK